MFKNWTYVTVKPAPDAEAPESNCLSWSVKADKHTKLQQSNHASQRFLWIRRHMFKMQKSKNTYDWGKAQAQGTQIRHEVALIGTPVMTRAEEQLEPETHEPSAYTQEKLNLDIWNICAQQVAGVWSFALAPFQSPANSKTALSCPRRSHGPPWSHALDKSQVPGVIDTSSETYVKWNNTVL